MTIAHRVALVLLGLILVLAGLLVFLTMCGSNAHVAGAMLGSVGGAFVALRRKAHRVRWFATAGGVLFALLGMGMEYLSAGSCAGAFHALGSGALTGFGVGAVVDGARHHAKPEAA